LIADDCRFQQDDQFSFVAVVIRIKSKPSPGNFEIPNGIGGVEVIGISPPMTAISPSESLSMDSISRVRISGTTLSGFVGSTFPSPNVREIDGLTFRRIEPFSLI
jgi:hypothetical protein